MWKPVKFCNMYYVLDFYAFLLIFSSCDWSHRNRRENPWRYGVFMRPELRSGKFFCWGSLASPLGEISFCKAPTSTKWRLKSVVLTLGRYNKQGKLSILSTCLRSFPHRPTRSVIGDRASSIGDKAATPKRLNIQAHKPANTQTHRPINRETQTNRLRGTQLEPRRHPNGSKQAQGTQRDPSGPQHDPKELSHRPPREAKDAQGNPQRPPRNIMEGRRRCWSEAIRMLVGPFPEIRHFCSDSNLRRSHVGLPDTARHSARMLAKARECPRWGLETGSGLETLHWCLAVLSRICINICNHNYMQYLWPIFEYCVVPFQFHFIFATPPRQNMFKYIANI